MLPRGVDEYLARHRTQPPMVEQVSTALDHRVSVETNTATSAEQREAKKALARIDRQLVRIAQRESELHALLEQHASDYEKLAELDVQLRDVLAEKEALEEEWLDAASLLE